MLHPQMTYFHVTNELIIVEEIPFDFQFGYKAQVIRVHWLVSQRQEGILDQIDK